MPDLIIDPATLTACAHAAHAFDRERLGIPVWDDLPPETHIEYHDLARAVLMAALTPRIPLIAAKAWEEGYQACRNRPRIDGYLVNRANPYQTRADRVERGEA